MAKPGIFRKLFAILTATILAVLLVLVLLVSRVHEQFVVQEQQQHLQSLARLAAREAGQHLGPGREAALQEAVQQLDPVCGARVTLIRADGTVLADSRRSAASLESHAGRPEIKTALAGRIGYARRFSTSTGMRMLYVALPLQDPGEAPVILRLALPDQALQDLMVTLRRRVWLVAALLVVLAAGTGAWLSWRISRPLQAMRRVADDLAEGRAESVEWPVPDTRETLALAEALRRMSGRLQDKIADVEELLAEQRAVFASMVDGVLLVDREGRLVEVNHAAAAWLGCEVSAVRGRDVVEVVRNSRLHELVRQTLAGVGPVEGDLVLHGARERHIQVHGAPVRPGTGRVAAVLALTDVTRLREMEKAHRDFVANASHELKTPVTTIKGFAESLLEDDLDQAQMKKFAGIVARQADQLSALIEDLLQVTRLEHQQQTGPLEREQVMVAPVVWAAIESCQAEAQDKQMVVTVRCPKDLQARLKVDLIQRALTNLVENAIKYSPPHTEVTVEAMEREGQLVLEVRDQGPGIAPEHHDRIFERFYRVDKSRSRKLGGTGLGLAIVRHAAEAHGGKVMVRSAPGQGAVFTLCIPLQGGAGV